MREPDPLLLKGYIQHGWSRFMHIICWQRGLVDNQWHKTACAYIYNSTHIDSDPGDNQYEGSSASLDSRAYTQLSLLCFP